MIFKTGGSETMRVMNSNLGIGLIAPTARLHVVGTSQLTGDTTITGNLTVSGTLTITPKIAMLLGGAVQTTIANAGMAFIFSTTVQNTFGIWNSSLNQMTTLYAGLVEISVCLTLASGSTQNLSPYLIKNNVALASGIVMFNQAFDVGIGIARTGTVVVQCAVGDTLVIKALNPVNIQMNNGSYVYFKML